MAKNTASISLAQGRQSSHIAEEADDSVLGSLGFDLNLFAFQFINVAIVFCILWFLILKPLVKKLKERQDIVGKSLDDAKEIETKLAMSDTLSRQKIEDALHHADRIIGEAHEKGKAEGRRMHERTKQDIAQLIGAAKQVIAGERKKMKEELHQETAGLIVEALRKIFSKVADDRVDAAFVEEILYDVSHEHPASSAFQQREKEQKEP